MPKCGCKGKECGCQTMFKLKGNIAQKEIRFDTLDGQEMMIVPLVMAKSGVVMNGGLIPDEEFQPSTWNGVPLTINHPSEGDEFISANTPKVLEKFSVGRIFNATFEDGSLKAEAWINVKKANKLDKKLVSKIKTANKFDVSTGFLAEQESVSGESKGRAYEVLFRNINPDHLALLPDESGACSWQDGCGIRPNKELEKMDKKAIAEALKLIANSLDVSLNEDEETKGESMVSRLIGSEDTPFGDDDKEALESMSSETVQALADSFGVTSEDDEPEANEDVDDDDDAEPEANADGDEPEKKGEDMKAKKPKKTDPSSAGLSKEDKEALTFARQTFKDHRAKLVDTIVTNSDMEKSDLEAMETATLEKIANGVTKSAKVLDFSGRATPVETDDSDKDEVEAMAASGVVGMIKAQKESA